MDQNLENYDLSENNANVMASMRVTKTGQGKRSRKCNQCEYSSFHASDLRRHLKTHSGEKLNKCNQCDYASSQAGNLSRHVKRTVEKNQTFATSVTMHPAMQAI